MRIPVSPAVVRTIGPPLMSTLAGSWRMSGPGSEPWRALRRDGVPIVFLLWHEVLLPLLWWHRGEGIAILVSQAREGRYLGEYAEQLGYHQLCGSSTRGGVAALLGAVRSLHNGQPVAFTPDGPRGPRREMKPGIVRLAQRTQASIVPLHARVTSAWRMKSWDQLVVPVPFSRIEVCCGVPFRVAPGDAGLMEGMAHCATALHQLERAG